MEPKNKFLLKHRGIADKLSQYWWTRTRTLSSNRWSGTGTSWICSHDISLGPTTRSRPTVPPWKMAIEM